MHLFEEFNLYEDMWELTEAKADAEKLVAFAGENLANRFLAIKDRLKAPENDLYYWIKNKTIDELADTVLRTETTKSKTAIKKDAADKGIEIVCETDHWKVYYITSYEAAKKYGYDTKWCVSGKTDAYYNTYSRWNVKFYFLITKENYNPAGTNSKICLVVYPGDRCEVFNQQDKQIKLTSIPYIEEINIPGLDLNLLYDEYNDIR